MLKYGFFNSLNHDRVYDAEDVSAIFNNIITDGVFDNYGKIFATRASGNGMDVIVGTGRAWFDSTWTMSDSDITLTVPAADVSLTRIDSVILEVDHSTGVRANSIKILKGTPAATPVAPTLTHGPDVYQHALANITLAAGTASVTDSMIDVLVGKSGCPFVTSVLESVAIDDLFAKWENDFSTWFADLQAQLSGDIATNLQNQITALEGSKLDKSLYEKDKIDLDIKLDLIQLQKAYVRLAIKTSKGNPLPGVMFSNIYTKEGSPVVSNNNGIAEGYVDSGDLVISITDYVDIIDATKTIKGIIIGNIYEDEIIVDTRDFLVITTSKNIKFSENVSVITYALQGGGGGGGSRFKHSSSDDDWTNYGGGGGSGYWTSVSNDTTINKNTEYTLQVGSGGSGASKSSNSGNGGGSTSFNGHTVSGGQGGSSGYSAPPQGGAGGAYGGNGQYSRPAIRAQNGDSASAIFEGVTFGGGGGGGGAANTSKEAGGIGGTAGGGYGSNNLDNRSMDATANGAGGGGGNIVGGNGMVGQAIFKLSLKVV